ncbi:MAG: hypothetical protein ACI8TP_002229 [Acidimicrobiales bacterium]|jgi:hypothetical protein
MAGLASLAAVTLALVLAWAAAVKLARPDQTTTDFRQLGLPVPALLARLVPMGELAVAVTLVLSPGWGGVAGFVLLAAFSSWLYSVVRSGRVVSCGCFGSASTEPVSMVEVVRNLLLMALAATAVSISSLVRPDFPSVVLFTTLTMLGAVAVQLVALAGITNGLFRAELAGEMTEGVGT